MKLFGRAGVACVAGVSIFAAASYGAVIHNETTDGDLSDSGLTPTSLSVAAGSNIVLGMTGNVTGAADRDYFTITVPSGHVLSSIVLLPGTVSLGPQGDSFIGIQAGSQVTLPFFPPDATGLLGWMHYDAADVGTDILPNIGASDFGATGFVPPLPPGPYAFWIQELNAGAAPYGLDIMITATPEPGSWAMVVAGLAALGGRAVRRRRDQNRNNRMP